MVLALREHTACSFLEGCHGECASLVQPGRHLWWGGGVRKLGTVMCLVPETFLPSTMNPRGPKALLNVLMKGVGAWAWCQNTWIQISALSLSAYWQDT